MPNTPEFSQLTDAGIEQIKKTRNARFDLRNHELTKAAVGLDGQDRGPIIGGADGPMITVEFLGPEQAETIETNTLMFLSPNANKPYSGIVFWKSFDDAQQCLDELRDDVSRWGLSAARVDRWAENSKGESNYQQVVSMGVGRSGLVIDVEAYLKDGRALLKYDIYLEPDLYTPQALDEIRTTGIAKYNG
ncbi:hypothetical protein AB0N05_32220 [Nocardia sp. NPDC051030]|uniref:hypothetical protein n=1 Tax=Nocardia sp. NPDC051030 TaxID=3155162 RepID=UPI0034351BCB